MLKNSSTSFIVNRYSTNIKIKIQKKKKKISEIFENLNNQDQLAYRILLKTAHASVCHMQNNKMDFNNLRGKEREHAATI